MSAPPLKGKPQNIFGWRPERETAYTRGSAESQDLTLSAVFLGCLSNPRPLLAPRDPLLYKDRQGAVRSI